MPTLYVQDYTTEAFKISVSLKARTRKANVCSISLLLLQIYKCMYIKRKLVNLYKENKYCQVDSNINGFKSKDKQENCTCTA